MASHKRAEHWSIWCLNTRTESCSCKEQQPCSQLPLNPRREGNSEIWGGLESPANPPGCSSPVSQCSPLLSSAGHCDSQAAFWALPVVGGVSWFVLPFEIHLQQLSWRRQGQTKCFAHGVESDEFCSAPSFQGKFVPGDHPGCVQQRIQGTNPPAVGGLD